MLGELTDIGRAVSLLLHSSPPEDYILPSMYRQRTTSASPYENYTSTSEPHQQSSHRSPAGVRSYSNIHFFPPNSQIEFPAGSDQSGRTRLFQVKQTFLSDSL